MLEICMIRANWLLILTTLSYSKPHFTYYQLNHAHTELIKRVKKGDHKCSNSRKLGLQFMSILIRLSSIQSGSERKAVLLLLLLIIISMHLCLHNTFHVCYRTIILRILMWQPLCPGQISPGTNKEI